MWCSHHHHKIYSSKTGSKVFGGFAFYCILWEIYSDCPGNHYYSSQREISTLFYRRNQLDYWVSESETRCLNLGRLEGVMLLKTPPTEPHFICTEMRLWWTEVIFSGVMIVNVLRRDFLVYGKFELVLLIGQFGPHTKSSNLHKSESLDWFLCSKLHSLMRSHTQYTPEEILPRWLKPNLLFSNFVVWFFGIVGNLFESKPTPSESFFSVAPSIY